MVDVPPRWKKGKLSDIASASYGMVDGPFGSNLSSSEYIDSGVPVIRGSNLSLGTRYFNDTGFVFVAKEKAEELIRSNCVADDIIFTKKGTLGQTGIIPENSNYRRYLLSSNQMKMTVNQDLADPYYVYHYVSSPNAIDKILNDSASTGVPQINLAYLRTFPIMLPPLDEQRKIAEILSTWHEAIWLTEQLIAALVRRKRALMQLLLTGEVRFAEFEGREWEETTLDEVSAKLESGGTPSTQIEEYWTGTIPWITGADFSELKISQVRRYISEDAVSNSSTKIAKRGDILLVSRTGVGKIALAPFDIAISQDITRVVPKTEIMVTSYLLYYLAYSIAQLARFNQGTSINGVKREDLKNHVVHLTSLEEQAKIADLLELCDEEIAILQSCLNQLNIEKRGLMQQLLTGQVRVGVEA